MYQIIPFNIEKYLYVPFSLKENTALGIPSFSNRFCFDYKESPKTIFKNHLRAIIFPSLTMTMETNL